MEAIQKWKKIVNRMDLVVIIATVVYYVRVVRNLGGEMFGEAGFNYFRFVQLLADNTGLLGILLLSFSLVTFFAIVYIGVKEQMAGRLSERKTVALIIWNGIFIVADAMLLHMALF